MGGGRRWRKLWRSSAGGRILGVGSSWTDLGPILGESWVGALGRVLGKSWPRVGRRKKGSAEVMPLLGRRCAGVAGSARSWTKSWAEPSAGGDDVGRGMAAM